MSKGRRPRKRRRRFKKIPDTLWVKIEPLLEPFKRKKSGGKPPLPFRQVLNGILYLLTTGCQWEMLPECYGSKSSVHEHFQRWVHAGVFEQVYLLCLEHYHALEGLRWQWQSMDGCLLTAPLCGKDASQGLGANPTDRGRSGTKLHLLVDEEGMPLSFVVQGANVHDSRLVSATHQACLLPCPEEHPHLCLDRGYDYPRVHEEVECLGYEAHIKQGGIQEEAVCLDEGQWYPARRWVVERTFAWLKGFRAIRVRFTRLLDNYKALVAFACALVLFRRVAA